MINIQKSDREKDKFKVYCKCGHPVHIYPFERKNKKVCSWCGHLVYINEKEKFKEKMEGLIKSE